MRLILSFVLMLFCYSCRDNIAGESSKAKGSKNTQIAKLLEEDRHSEAFSLALSQLPEDIEEAFKKNLEPKKCFIVPY